MSTTKTNHRSLATLKLPKAAAALITFAQQIVTAMTGNAFFPSPIPALALVTAAIAALQLAEAAALARTKGAVTTRDEKRTALVQLLQQLKAYVQAIADQQVENGASIIQSAGIAVKKAATRHPRVFAAKQGAVSGTTALVAPSAGARSSYEWEYSIDGGKTWVAVLATVQAKTTVTGLAPGSTVEFRYRTVTKTGVADWSQTVALIVK